MTITELGSIGEFIGSVAVLITLVYLAVQVRQTKNQIETNTNAVLGSSEIDGNNTTLQHLVSLYSDEAVMNIVLRGAADEDNLSATDYSRFNAFLDAAFQLHQITFLQWKKHLLSDEYWEFCTRWFGTRMIATPGTQKWWKRNESLFVPGYRELISSVIENRGWEDASKYLGRSGAD